MIVEDDVLLALDLADTLRDAGLTILGPFGTVDAALDAVRADRPAGAILDIDLKGILSFPVADALAAANVPFMWLSASSRDVPAAHQARPFLSKPFAAPTLLRVVRRLVKTS